MLAGDAGAAVTQAANTVEASIPAETSQQNTIANCSEIAFVDSGIEQSEQLIELVRRGVEIVLVDSSSDVLSQMDEVIQSRGSISAVHIVSHGEAGRIQIGDQAIDSESLRDHEELLRSWRSSLSADADILLYGCDVAVGETGMQFLRSWSAMTGADVAASTDRTGNSASQGDWDFEATIGLIEAKLLASSSDLQQLNMTLPISIRAAGATGDEQMQLLIDGSVVQTWNNIGGDADTRQFQTYTYSGGAGVTGDRVRIAFTNDVYEPSQGIDRNLRIDNITVNGVTIESENPSVFGTGSWLPADGIESGFRQSEWLHANGYFEYFDNSSSGSSITIYAAGNENAETMQLWLNGSAVQTWNNIGGNANARQFVAYSFNASSTVTPDDVQIHFTNDLYVNNGQVDNNLRVDRVVIDGTTYQTEAPNVFSTGTWQNGDITPGFKEDETLHANGYFQYGSSTSAGTIALETSVLSVNEDAGSVTARVIRSGGSDGTITVDYGTQPGSAAANSDYTPVSGTLTFADGQTARNIVIPILNDNSTESLEQFNVTIDNVNGGATLLVPRTATVSIVDDEVALPNYANFNSVAGLNLNGNAARLVPRCV